MNSINVNSLRLRSVTGLVALLLVGSGVGAVYANTASPADTTGSSTATGTGTGTGTGTTGTTTGGGSTTGTSTGTSTGTATGTTTGTATGTGTTPVKSKPIKKDKNGCAVNRVPGNHEFVRDSRQGKTISVTVVPSKSEWKSIKRHHGKHSIWARGHKVGSFRITKFDHIVFTTSNVKKNHSRVVFSIRFGNEGVLKARSTFKW